MKKIAIFLVLFAAAGLTACVNDVCEQSEAGMVQINSANGTFLIDSYEASRTNASAETAGTGVTLACNYRGTVPWNNVTYQDALNACLDAGKRLCTRSEWVEACAQTYPYGAAYVAGTCNDTNGVETSLTGAKSGCRTNTGIYDLSGNVREWVEGGILMGGAYNSSSDDVRCASALPQANYDTYTPNQGDGFRCCQDVSLTQN